MFEQLNKFKETIYIYTEEKTSKENSSGRTI